MSENRIDRFLGEPSEEGTVRVPSKDPAPPSQGIVGESVLRQVGNAGDLLEAPCAGACGGVVRFPPPKLRPGDHERVYCVPCATRVSGSSPPEGVEYARVGRHPAHRNTALISDRFTKRFGRPPKPEAVKAFLEKHLAWDKKFGDLGEMNDAIERFRLSRPSLWEMAYPVPPKDDLEGLLDIAKQIGRSLDNEASLG